MDKTVTPWYKKLILKEEPMVSVLRSLRLYRLWLSIALTLPGSVLDRSGLLHHACPRQVANFWIIRSLLSVSTLRPSGVVQEVEQRIASVTSLLKILSYGQPLTEHELIKLSLKAGTEKEVRDLGSNILSVSSIGEEGETPVPSFEIGDKTWLAVIQSFPTEVLDEFARMTCTGHRMFRFEHNTQTYERPLEAVLYSLPPTPGYCIVERAIAGLLNDDQDLRNIFMFKDSLWDMVRTGHQTKEVRT